MTRQSLTSAVAGVARRLFQHPSVPQRVGLVPIESLETRRLLATINWANEFADNFASYGSNENVARNIVRRAISDWEAVIVDFNYDDTGSNQNDTYQLTVNAADIGGRGSAGSFSRDDSTDRKPDAATVTMDNLGTTWYFDPLVDAGGIPDDSEFTSLENLFTAEAVGGAADAGNDFYRTIVHEIGHAMGILDSTGFLKVSDFPRRFGRQRPLRQLCRLEDRPHRRDRPLHHHGERRRAPLRGWRRLLRSDAPGRPHELGPHQRVRSSLADHGRQRNLPPRCVRLHDQPAESDQHVPREPQRGYEHRRHQRRHRRRAGRQRRPGAFRYQCTIRVPERLNDLWRTRTYPRVRVHIGHHQHGCRW